MNITNVSAFKVNVEPTIKKWVFTQYYNCLLYKVNTPVFSQASDTEVFFHTVKLGNSFYMPSYNYGNELNNVPTNCFTILAGNEDKKTKGAFDYGYDAFKHITWAGDPSGAKAMLQTMGYSFAPNEESGSFNLRMEYTTGIKGEDNDEWSTIKKTDVTSLHFVYEKRNGSYVYSVTDPLRNLFAPVSFTIESHDGKQYLRIRDGYESGTRIYDAQDISIELSKDSINETFENIKESGIEGKSFGYTVLPDSTFFEVIMTLFFPFYDTPIVQIAKDLGQSFTYITTFKSGACVDYSEAGSDCLIDYAEGGEYRFTNTYENRKKSVENISNNTMTPADTRLTDTEKYNLYLYYLEKSIPVGVPNRFTCDQEAGGSSTSLTPIEHIKDSDGEFKTCYANFNNMDTQRKMFATQRVHDENINQIWTDIILISMDDIVQFFKDVNPNELDGVWNIGEIGQFKVEYDGTFDDSKCYEADLSGQGWLLCPVLNNSTRSVSWFESIINEWMTFDVRFLNPESEYGGGAYGAWGFFRNFANSLMIIVLLVVIFSQLTGYGIDNYGVKKILPRLIAMAILINLSYYMCEILVDLSNTLGVGLSRMFSSVGEAIDPGGGGEWVATLVTILLALLGTAGALGGAAMAGAGGGWVGIIIALILALLLVLVAVLMFFAMLGARLVIILMFTVISPIAIASYVLPNTQQYFKKWWNVYWTALVMYPICGAIYGLSSIIKAIVFIDDLTGMNFWMGIVAVITPFLPFLMLPSLLKAALAGLGKMGATLEMLGNGLRKGIQSAANGIKNTDRYQNAAKESKANMRIRSMERFNRNNREAINDGTLSGAKARKYRRLNLYGNAAYDQREREYGVAFSHQTKLANQRALQDGIKTNNAAMASAAYTALLKQNAPDEAIAVLGKMSKSDWDKMGKQFNDRIWQTMSMTPGADSLAGFAKYKMSGGKAGYDDWVNNNAIKNSDITSVPYLNASIPYMTPGVTMKELAEKNGYVVDDDSVKYTSLAKYQDAKGARGMVNYSDDEVKEVGRHWQSLSLGRENQFMQTMLNTALSAQSPKAQLAAGNIMSAMLAAGHIGALGAAATPHSLGSMSDRLVDDIKNGIRDGLKNGSISIEGYKQGEAVNDNHIAQVLYKNLEPQFTKAMKDNQVMSNMSGSMEKLTALIKNINNNNTGPKPS